MGDEEALRLTIWRVVEVSFLMNSFAVRVLTGRLWFNPLFCLGKFEYTSHAFKVGVLVTRRCRLQLEWVLFKYSLEWRTGIWRINFPGECPKARPYKLVHMAPAQKLGAKHSNNVFYLICRMGKSALNEKVITNHSVSNCFEMFLSKKLIGINAFMQNFLILTKQHFLVKHYSFEKSFNHFYLKGLGNVKKKKSILTKI